MRRALFLAALSAALLPGLAVAAGCRGEHADETAASCLPGMAWDEVKGTCVEKPTS